MLKQSTTTQKTVKKGRAASRSGLAFSQIIPQLRETGDLEPHPSRKIRSFVVLPRHGEHVRPAHTYTHTHAFVLHDG